MLQCISDPPVHTACPSLCECRLACTIPHTHCLHRTKSLWLHNPAAHPLCYNASQILLGLLFVSQLQLYREGSTFYFLSSVLEKTIVAVPGKKSSVGTG